MGNSINDGASPRVVMPTNKREQSRYEFEQVGAGLSGSRTVARLELTQREFLDPDELESEGTYTWYQVKESDRLDQIAFEYLGDSRLWWVIADLNPEEIPDTLMLPTGQYIKLPQISQIDRLLA